MGLGLGLGVGVRVRAAAAASGESKRGNTCAAASVSGLNLRSSLARRGSAPAAAASQSAVSGCGPKRC